MVIRTGARFAAAALLAASAAAFALGTALERTAEPGTIAVVAAPSVGSGNGSTTHAAPTTPPTEAQTDVDSGHEGAAPQSIAGAAADADGGHEGAVAAPTIQPTNEAGADSHATTGEAAGASGQSEQLLGINPEAPGLVIVAVVLSLVFAVLILTIPSPAVAVLIAVALLAFAALDIREISHQVSESRPGLALLAAVIALMHLLAAAACLTAARSTQRTRRVVDEAKAHATQ